MNNFHFPFAIKHYLYTNGENFAISKAVEFAEGNPRTAEAREYVAYCRKLELPRHYSPEGHPHG